MNCSFCGNEIELGTEKIFVSKKGKAFYFCSSKCEKNLLKLKRKPRRVRWTQEYRKEKAIRLKGLERPAEKKKKKPAEPKEKTAEKAEEKKHPKPKEKPKEEHAKKPKPKEKKAEKPSKPKAKKKEKKSKKSKKDKK